jgi:hypothetical protein
MWTGGLIRAPKGLISPHPRHIGHTKPALSGRVPPHKAFVAPRGQCAWSRGVSSGRHRQDFRDNGRLPICARLGCQWRSDKIKLAVGCPLPGYGGQGPSGLKQYWRPRSCEGNARRGLCAWPGRVSTGFEMSRRREYLGPQVVTVKRPNSPSPLAALTLSKER